MSRHFRQFWTIVPALPSHTVSSASIRSMLLVVMLGLQACGFHLRGAEETLAQSFAELELICDRKGDFLMCHNLSKRIVAMGTSISSGAPYKLLVSRETSKQRALTLNPDASASEYELRHFLRYQLVDKASGDTLSSRVVERQQIYRHSASALIAKDREQENISEQLDNTIIDIILREISLLKRQTN